MNIKTIAKEAGVSVSTVSKVINGYEDISKETREKVWSVIKRFNYQPNQIARVLCTKKSWLIGLLYDVWNDYENEFFSEIIMSFKHTVEESGYNILFLNLYKIKNENISYVSYCEQYNLNGILIIGFKEDDPYIKELIEKEIPCIGIDIPINGKKCGYVTSDNYGGIAKAVDYLYELGHRKIGLINGRTDMYVARERYKGFISAMKKNNIEIVKDWICNGDFSEESGYTVINEMLKRGSTPSAIIVAGGDNMAYGVINALKGHGLKVPEDISIIGFDDIRSAKIFTPPLTTIRQDKLMMGKAAAWSLINMINDKSFKAPVTIIPTELIIRESTKSI
ncbi:transcriptional regulator, LacI family [Caldanaerobius fijiensis DSM 17918]|uniref:Transcriptional regulator, LacI family n=1 Tax=Caldanaerobius fijiensis DSM 17918 TaxID=1121256 RepID=A0A1M4W3H1_9THEO|nr:LacI family DNA-binding transcriptional regulator [Caldanaerobius fijiensis]SHE75759.1 transcriptional regulator, LacI family [Caldanaerobius fijiensis DSM 17918]